MLELCSFVFRFIALAQVPSETHQVTKLTFVNGVSTMCVKNTSSRTTPSMTT